jgi:hypothetical protein
MGTSRLPLAVALAVIVLGGVFLVNAFLGERTDSAAATSPALQTLERARETKSTDERMAEPLSRERIAVESKADLPTPPPPPVEEAKPADLRAVEKAQWEKEFAGLKRTELLEASTKISRKLGELTSAPIIAEFDAGRYEVVGHGNSLSSDNENWDHAKIYGVQFTRDSDEIRLAVLSESTYPEFYAIKRKILWLENQADQPERRD